MIFDEWIFVWELEFPAKPSWSKKTGHWKISVVVGISGRKFEFPVERSNFRSDVQNLENVNSQKKNRTLEKCCGSWNFRSNVRISGFTFEFPVEPSKSGKK